MMRIPMIPRSVLAACATLSIAQAAPPAAFFEQHCYDCHGADTHKGNLDLTACRAAFKRGQMLASKREQ